MFLFRSNEAGEARECCDLRSAPHENCINKFEIKIRNCSKYNFKYETNEEQENETVNNC